MLSETDSCRVNIVYELMFEVLRIYMSIKTVCDDIALLMSVLQKCTGIFPWLAAMLHILHKRSIKENTNLYQVSSSRKKPYSECL